METTGTYVSWPQRLKVGAKSKKGKSTHLYTKNKINACNHFSKKIRMSGLLERLKTWPLLAPEFWMCLKPRFEINLCCTGKFLTLIFAW